MKQGKNRNDKLLSQLEEKDRILETKTEDYKKLRIVIAKTIHELKEEIIKMKN